MNLVDMSKVECVLQVPTPTDDGEGGHVTAWSDGEKFNAAVVLNLSANSRAAERPGTVNTYTVTTDKPCPLQYHDVFRNTYSDTTFRVVSVPTDTPHYATFQFSQVTAEEWELS